jgi:MFS family permease
MEHLAWLMIPGILVAAALWAATRDLPHRQNNHHEFRDTISAQEQRVRWTTVWLLFVGNVVRFTVNTALPVLFAVWAKSRIQDNPEQASMLNGNILAALTVGMGIFGISAGKLSPPGKEKRSILVLTLLGAVSVAVSGYAGTHFGVWALYIAAAFSALGFAAVIPTSISLAQRLLPGRTGLASGLMLGSSWGLSFTAPWLAEWFLSSKLSEAYKLPYDRIDLAFVAFGAVMMIALFTTAAMPSWLLRKVAK